jgi:hypothetical protein
MIKLGRFSGATFAVALLVCAFPVATSSQDKNAPSNAPANVFLQDEIVKLQGDSLAIKQELEQNLALINKRLDGIDRRLDDIDRLIAQRGTVGARPAPGASPDGQFDYSDVQSCCRRITCHVPRRGYVYDREPCCRYADRPVRHVDHPRGIYHPQPCCRYAYRELD